MLLLASLPCFVLFVALARRVCCAKLAISECIAACVVFTNNVIPSVIFIFVTFLVVQPRCPRTCVLIYLGEFGRRGATLVYCTVKSSPRESVPVFCYIIISVFVSGSALKNEHMTAGARPGYEPSTACALCCAMSV